LKAVKSAYNFVLVALAVLAGATIALAFLLIVIDVSMRATGFRPPAYTSAVVEYILLYFTLFAAPYLVRHKGHVYVDALTSRMAPSLRWWVNKFAYLVSVITSLIFSYIGFKLAFEAIQSGSIEERSIDVPSWVDYSPVGPVFLIIAIEFGRYLIGIDTMYADRTKGQDSL